MKISECFCGSRHGYQLQKTLRFELKPVGDTEKNISKFLEEDSRRAKDYLEVKLIIDNYHRFFIDDVLSTINLDWTRLFDALIKFGKDKDSSTELESIQSEYRISIMKLFEADKRFDALTASTPCDLFKKIFPKWQNISSQKNLEALNSFQKFSSYFIGFQENRKNIYSSEDIPTAVPYRIVNDNFSRYAKNWETIQKIKSDYPEILYEAQKSLISVLNGKTIYELFDVSNYNKYLTQNGIGERIGIDYYNILIGGYAEKNIKHKGINECINIYCQTHAGAAKVQLIPLYKQILSDRSTLSFVLDTIDNDAKLIKNVKDYYKQIEPVLEQIPKLFSRETLDSINQNEIFINRKNIPQISISLFGTWNELQLRMNEYAENNLKTKKEKKRWIVLAENDSKKGFFTFEELNAVLAYKGTQFAPLNIYLADFFIADTGNNSSVSALCKNICSNYDRLAEYMSQKSECSIKELDDKIKMENDKTSDKKTGPVELLKNFLDSVQSLMHKIKPLKNEIQGDSYFYSKFDLAYLRLSEIIPLYNKCRNYLTKKVSEPKKYKLNFNTPTLANGWDLSKEYSNNCIILRKGSCYYLGIFNPENKPEFKEQSGNYNEEVYKKMVYKLLPGPNKMLPKVFFSDKGISFYNPSEEIMKGYKSKKHLAANLDISFLHKLIDFFKDSLAKNPDWKIFDFKFRKTSDYQRIDEFYKDVADQGYCIHFRDIPADEINSLVKQGQLYLFQIYNKDFAPGANGKDNMHTIYWKSIFSAINLQDVIVKLNGEAELFYREKAIDVNNTPCHEKGSKLLNRLMKDGTPIAEKTYLRLYRFVNGLISEKELTAKEKVMLDSGNLSVKEAKCRIVKDRHYTVPKFLFHVPVSLNFKSPGNIKINDKVRKFLHKNPDVNIIGLDRGERNLIYMTIINQKGNILLQKSFNTVSIEKNGAVSSVNYQSKLKNREEERNEARKSWHTIGKIAELKDGYLSAVIHEISELAIKYNAVIIMEDLNFGFKRGRFHVERQVYQKFEKKLIDKLNYLVFKSNQPLEPGGVLNAYQLTAPFSSFKKLGKQSGFLFYVPAAYTSKIDPVTGFVDVFETAGITNFSKKVSFFEKFNSVNYDEKTESFVFCFDYRYFEGHRSTEMLKTEWKAYSIGKRIKYNCAIRTDHSIEAYSEINLTDSLKKLFSEHSIKWENRHDILPEILKISKSETKESVSFFDQLYRLFRLVLQMRNSNPETGDDYIISPVCNEKGEFYCSEKYKDNHEAELPGNADANGAYHIALKGLILIRRFSSSEVSKLPKIDLKISNSEWLAFRQR